MRSLLLTLILAPLVAAASPLPEFPFVYVYGAAHREVAPDNAVISFNIKSYHAQAEAAYRQQSEAANTILTFAEKLGVPKDDIIAQAIEKSVVRKEDDKGKELEIIGYETDRSVRIELKDLARFPKLIEFLYGLANVERISATFGSKDKDAILQGLTNNACKAAKESAERLTMGFQRKLGGVRAISENGFSGMGNAFGFPGDSGSYGATSTAMGRDFRVIPATISFHKGVYAIFMIE